MAEGLDKSHGLKLALTGTAAGLVSGLLGRRLQVFLTRKQEAREGD